MHIAIIGGGFSGAACALHLLRDHPGLHLRLTVVEPRETLGAGLAYSTTAPEHRTNVPAARMSVLPEDPSHFHRWLEDRGETADDARAAMPDGRLFPARERFGRYVDETLREAVAAHCGIVFRRLRQTVSSVDEAGEGFTLTVADGEMLHADAVVLAVSHSAPDTPRVLRGLGAALLANPWDSGALARITPQARVLVVGTGLTACDVMVTLLEHGHHGPITAVSRHGLLPRPRTSLPVEAEGDFSTDPEHSVSGLLARVRRAIAHAASAGRPWENVIDALRAQAGTVWGTLDWPVRQRLLRHLRTYWDVHRFQCAPQIEQAVAAAQASGQLRVMAATLVAAAGSADGVAVRLRRRGSLATEEVAADVVVNCTGPGHRSVTASHPVLRALAKTGALMPDPAALGIWVDRQSRVLRQDGTAWPNLFVAGPLARGTHGELMGLPQVSLQPRDVASHLAVLCETASVPA